MPACKECVSFFDGACMNISKHDKAKTRACVRTAVQSRVQYIKKGDKILEVGFGVWRDPRRLAIKCRASWFGVDIKRGSPDRPFTSNCSVEDMPFSDGHFDCCFAIETMEHWGEGGVKPEDGLKEIHRVLKKDGWLLVSVPIHMHGTDEFLFGDLDRITSYYDSSMWDIDVEHWRKDYEPLERFAHWRPRQIQPLKKEGFDLSKLYIWSLIIIAIKK